ncbi:heterokaryon incompatibility protein-domain-containing protein [Cadophora sp. MPI-SDFR-AT-0126]|nr:heterokaryon incompatibility protein-domain-containing protein [Leotiomycetes sp. MPI-SDFR-AT-0126]
MPLSPPTLGAPPSFSGSPNCFNDCPICYSITETNIQRMQAGEEIVLGTWAQFLAFAVAGTDETGQEQGACALCWRIVGQVVFVEGDGVYLNGATISMLFDEGKVKKNSRYLTYLSFRISNPERDMWLDPAFREKHLREDPERFKDVKSWKHSRAYTYHMAFYTNGGPTEHYVQQRIASPQVATGEVFNSARTWLKECLQTHSNCPNITSSAMPTRVLDVTQLSELLDMVRLKETNQTEKGQYIALSYCWGPQGQSIMLKESTLREFKIAIVVRELPQTLQDAILVTRKLGIRYLWIDALCIIQDSDSDKGHELTQMPSIYKNAILTISAAIAEDCERGFLEDREQIAKTIKQSFCVPLIWDIQEPDGELASEVWLCPDEDRGFKIKESGEEVIEGRGWTFQEAWLAPRLLMYGTGQVTWRCLSCTHTHGLQEEVSEKRTYDIHGRSVMPQYQDRQRFFLNPLQSLTSSMQQTSLDVPENAAYPLWLESWLIIASHYSRRQVSFQTDRLPALSAIASEFYRLHFDQYLAGLWRKSLPWALLWYCIPNKPKSGPINVMKNTTAGEAEQDSRNNRRHLEHLSMPQIYDLGTKYTRFTSMEHFQKGPPQQQHAGVKSGASAEEDVYIAPTWSFVSVDSGISFASHEWDGPHHSLIEIRSASTTPKFANVPYGQVLNGFITLTGPIQQFSADEVLAFFVVTDAKEWPHLFWDCIVMDESRVGREVLGPYMERQVEDEVVKAINAQLGVKERVTKRMLGNGEIIPKPEAKNTRPRPAKGTIPANSETQSGGLRDLYFLEVTWTETPRGLVLVRKGTGIDGVEVFQRVGFFQMGREGFGKTDWRMRGDEDVGGREWDWYAGLRMCTMRIV